MIEIYSIDGNIGSGKSTIVELLKKRIQSNEYIDFIFLEEPVNDWNDIKDKDGETMLSKFYKDQDKYSFSFQMMAYISRIHKLRECISKCNKNKKTIIITERSVYTDKNVFAKMLYDDKKIEEVNYKIYLKWFDEFLKEIPITGYIYVKTDPKICFERIKKRNRKGEDIPLKYLERCDLYHECWLTNVDLLINGNDEYDKIINLEDKYKDLIYNFIIENSLYKKRKLC